MVARRWDERVEPTDGGHADTPGDSSFDGNATSIFRDILLQTFTGIGPDATTITIDNNVWPPPGPSVPPFFATPGYDMTTGFGGPRADRFVAALAAQ